MKRVALPVLVLLLALPCAARTVRLKTADGVRLQGQWHAPKKARAALIALRLNDGEAWQAILAPATKRGLAVLTVDARGHGRSSRPKGATTDEALAAGMHHDVEAAIRWVQRRHKLGPDRIVLFGAGVGATAALQAGARVEKIAGAVLLTPAVKLPEATGYLATWAGRPLLLVSSVEDAEAGATPLYDAIPAPKEAVLLKLPQKDIRGAAMFGKVKNLAERLVEWAAIRLK